MLRVVFTQGFFLCHCDFETRHFPKKAGFDWSDGRKLWYTQSARAAVKLRQYFDDSAVSELSRMTIQNRPYSGPLPFPKNKTPYDYQLDPAALFALSRDRSYLGLAPRLGKTIVSAIVINALQTKAVFITPPFLTRTIESTLRAWTTGKPRISRLDPKEAPLEEPDILIVPDSILFRPEVRAEIRELSELARTAGKKPIVFVDEAHRFKEENALRTKAIFGGKDESGIIDDFPKQIYLSGTPMPNRPIELYPILSKVAPETIDFMTKHEYGMRYCGGRWDGFGYDYSGASHLEELGKRVIGPFMLRIKKVKGLPKKIEDIVVIGSLPSKIMKLEAKLLREHSPEDLMAGRVSSDHVSTYRKELGAIKVKPAIDFLRSLLDETEESILVFAFHREVISRLREGLSDYRPLVITGGVSNAERSRIELLFQSDPDHRLFIGNYAACGLGLTLAKAKRAVFVEFSWTATENDQASDRATIVGGEELYVQYLVYENSIDRKTIETNLRKRKITSYV